MVKPALVRVWRDASTVQFGVDTATAVVVGGVTSAVRQVLDLLDGTRDRDDLRSASARAGVPAELADAVVDRLATAGLLDDGAADTSALRSLDVAERDRLAPELASLTLLRREPGGGLRALAKRQAATVGIVGTGRLAAAVEGLLRSCGVGRVLARPDPARLLADAPKRRAPDLILVTAYGAPVPEQVDAVARLGRPHLAVVARELAGVVGPLVRPGETACVRCLDLHRADRDPAWPLVALQAATGAPTCPPVPAPLISIVAGTAALQAIAQLDGDDPATLDGTLEIRLPDWRLRRRSWPPHPDCRCTLARAG
jgi:bacteriocin biosynthesis cyclodehydratase domain-containing protein